MGRMFLYIFSLVLSIKRKLLINEIYLQVVDLTAMSFDHTLRRLITGGRDGTVKVWNFHNGDCLRVMDTQGNAEVSRQVSFPATLID